VDAKMFYLNIGMLKDLEFKKVNSYGERINDGFCFRAKAKFCTKNKKEILI
jgi:hypothetical protein